MKPITTLASLVTLVSLGTTAGCAAQDTDLETAFCDALGEPASRTVGASPAPEGAADVTDEARVDIELVAMDSAYGGYVTYRPDESGSFAFGLTEDVDLRFYDASGTEVPIDTEVVGAACDELAVRYSVALEVATYTIAIGPASNATIGFIAEESDDDL